MVSAREFPRRDSKGDATADLRQIGKGRPHMHPASDTLASELAMLLGELHQTLQDYAPTWYTQTMDTRIREKLAAAQRTGATFYDRS